MFSPSKYSFAKSLSDLILTARQCAYEDWLDGNIGVLKRSDNIYIRELADKYEALTKYEPEKSKVIIDRILLETATDETLSDIGEAMDASVNGFFEMFFRENEDMLENVKRWYPGLSEALAEEYPYAQQKAGQVFAVMDNFVWNCDNEA